ncbi:MAG: MATE family efflux transporter [Christensenellaceae bacterium]|nr:MATE family efflux transporter [Christensenellaceae bacterium]
MNRSIFSIERLLPRTGALGETPSTGEAYRDVARIALPSVAEMVLMSLIGMMDAIMVGQVLGAGPLAAVGLVDQPRMLLMSVFFALNIGVTAILARRKGEERRDEANRTLRNALVLCLLCSAAMMTVGLMTSRGMMRLAGAQADTVRDAETYYRILVYFLPVNALTMCICAAQRGVGNTRLTMYVNTASNLVNVVFNYLLIGGNLGFPRLEVEGAAYATGIGFCVGLVLALVTVARPHGYVGDGFLHLRWRDDWRIDRQAMGSIVRMGWGAMLEQVALRVGFFWYARIVADLGTLAFAAHQICMKFLNLSFTFGDGIGIAGTSLVGQMLGRKRPDLAQAYGKAAQRMALVVSLALASSIALFRTPLSAMFVGDVSSSAVRAEDVIALASRVMLMVALFQPFQTTSVVISGALRGAGDNKYVALVMLLCVSLIRPLCAMAAIYLITHTLSRPDIALMGCWAASLIDMMLRMTLVYRRFNGGKWHDIAV